MRYRSQHARRFLPPSRFSKGGSSLLLVLVAIAFVILGLVGLYLVSPDGSALESNDSVSQFSARRLGPIPAGRSPMPEPGEVLEAPLPFKRLADPEPPRIPAGGVVPWDKARQFVGRTIKVEGAIVSTRNIGPVCFLNFTQHWRDRFYVVIESEVFDSWPEPPEKWFLNRRIRVSGPVGRYGRRPQIKVTQADQIELVPDSD